MQNPSGRSLLRPLAAVALAAGAMKFLALGRLPMVLIVTFVPDLSLALPRRVLGIE